MSPLDGNLWGDLHPWYVPPLDTREMIGGPLDGELWRTLPPEFSIARYYPHEPSGDFVYVPPDVVDELPRDLSPAHYIGRCVLLGALLGVLTVLLLPL